MHMCQWEGLLTCALCVCVHSPTAACPRQLARDTEACSQRTVRRHWLALSQTVSQRGGAYLAASMLPHAPDGGSTEPRTAAAASSITASSTGSLKSGKSSFIACVACTSHRSMSQRPGTTNRSRICGTCLRHVAPTRL